MSKAEFIPGNWQLRIDAAIHPAQCPLTKATAPFCRPTARTSALNAKYERLKRLEQESAA